MSFFGLRSDFHWRLDAGQVDFARVDEICHWIPSGMNVWDSPRESFDLERLRCFNKLYKKTWLKNSLGTLGGGNHFIEIDHSEDGTYWLVIHSGSRRLGRDVATYWQNEAFCQTNGFDPKLFAKKKVNPLLGATGLSAVPMASRVCNTISTKYDPKNHVLNYCMSSNISGVIGSAVAAGVLISFLG